MAKLLGHVSSVTEMMETISNVPESFWEHLTIMDKKTADALPSHKEYDCKIELNPGKKAPWGPIYPLLEKELETLREWLKEILRI